MKQYNRYFFIEKKIKDKGFDPDRHELIGIFTKEEKSRLTDLTDTEYREFLQWLTTKFDIHSSPAPEHKVKMDKMRKKIIALFIHQMDFNYHDLDKWLISKGVVKKSLNNLSYHELVKTVSQAEQVYASHLKALNKR